MSRSFSCSRLSVIVILLGGALFAATSAICVGAEPTTAESLERKVSVDFTGSPLAEALKQLEKQANVQIQIDTKALADVGIPLDRPLTFRLANVSLRSTLRHMLRDLDLDFVVRDEVVIVTTPDESNKYLVSRVYNVRDLVGMVNRLTDESDHEPLIEVITSTIKPTSWDTVGGAGSIKGFRETLVVSQTFPIHDEVAALLAALRQARAQPAGKLGHDSILVGDRPENATIRKTLEQTASLDGQERTLADWAKLIGDKYGIPILFDHRALADIGLEETRPLKFQISNVPLRTALALMLREIDLTFVIRDEVLMITTPDEAAKRLEPHVYKVPDLAATHDEQGQERTDFTSLIDMITATIKPNSWDTVGGAGSIMGFELASVLVCSQTAEVHEEVENLISQTRQVRADPEAQGAGGRPWAGGSNDYFVGRYVLKLPENVTSEAAKTATVEQLIAVIKDLVDPNGWKKDHGYIHAVGTTVVVQQTPDVRRQVAKLLKDLRLLDTPVPKRGSKESGTRYQRSGAF